ncbi:MAG: amidohydrolase family protein [Alphaproteobacteria bacterium]|nr:amidohydrolase family protein [Alphaproteobacteria bacterium]
MTAKTDDAVSGADIRAKLDHPVIDADGHMIETTFAILDFVKQVGGAEFAERYEKILMSSSSGPSRRAVWTANSGPATLDRVTGMLPKLFKQRLDDAGIDFAVAYGTVALTVLRIGDDELRAVVYRAMNTMYADMFSEVSDRLTPAALIPMHDPDEAIAELDYVVNELGLKAIVMNTMIYRPAPEVEKEAPQFAHYTMVPHSPAIDHGDTYDPVWAKCVELGVAPTCHNSFRGRGSTHGSPTNYVYNSLGSFGQGSEYFCRSLFFGGVPKRFPKLKFAFLEGGAGWATQLYNSLFEYWEKRNLAALKKNLDPAKLDIDLMIEMFERYGNGYLTADRIRANRYQPISSNLLVPPEEVNDFAPTGVERPEDIRTIFDNNFFFGCEADDRLNAVAFDARLNHLGARLNAIFGSDIGHWDVPDMTRVLVEAHEMVEDGFITEDDFRDFTCANVVKMHTGMNPDFFRGTAVESAVDKYRAETVTAAAE